MLDVIHAHHQDMHENILARRLCDLFVRNVDFSINRRTMPPENAWCRTDHHVQLLNMLQFIVFLKKKSIISNDV